jgi:PAS domain S-box-containing protein
MDLSSSVLYIKKERKALIGLFLVVFFLLVGALSSYGNNLEFLWSLFVPFFSFQKRDSTLFLKKNKDRYQTVLEQMPEVAIQGYDHNRKVIFWNKASEKMFGYTQKQATGQRIEDLIQPEDQRERSIALFNECLETGTPEPSAEVEFRRADGQLIYVFSSCVLFINNQEEPEVYRVIVDRTLIQQSFRRSEFQKLLADISSDLINVTPTTISGKLENMMASCSLFMRVDRSCLLRYNIEKQHYSLEKEWCRASVDSIIEQMPGIPFSEVHWPKNENQENPIFFISDTQKAEGSCFFEPAFLNQCQARSMLILPLAKGRERFGILVFETMRDLMPFEERLLDLLKVLSNILTDVLDRYHQDLALRENAMRLSQSNKTKDKVFSIIAHDLRSPFQTFIGLTELMSQKDSGLTPREIQYYSQLMHQQAQNTFHLLENLLEWSKLQREIIRVDVSQIPLVEFFNQCVADFRDTLVQKKISMRVDVDPSLVGVFDCQMMNSVFRNLLSNALKFTKEGGLFILSAQKAVDGTLLLSITDTGIGIPPEILPDLFSINDHKGRNGLHGEKSTGLGLVLCKEFVELHKGRISARSEINVGSTFLVEIPQ